MISRGTTLRAAVIGAGRIADQHLRYLQGSAVGTLVAVCDRSPITARYAAHRFGAPEVYTDHQALLHDVRPDVVHILTPAASHEELIRDCLSADADVICEKPITTSRDAFRNLRALADERGRVVVEDHNYRFNRPLLEIARLVHEGALGEVREVEVRIALDVRGAASQYADVNTPHPSHRLPGGVVHEFLPHLCYITCMFLPSFDRVTAIWSNYGGGALFAHDDLDAIVIGDTVHARLRFSSRTKPDCFAITVRGSRGAAQTDLFLPYLQVDVPRRGPTQLAPIINQHCAGRERTRAARRNFGDRLRQRTAYEGLHTLLDRTYRALRAGDAPPVTHDDIDRALALADVLVREARQA